MRRGSIIPAIRALQPPPYYYDGIHLDFRYGAGALGCYVKAAGAAPTIAPLTTLFTFTGGNQSMYMGPAGLLVQSVTNTPRIEYDASGNCLGLLMEAARTNLMTYSQDLAGADWSALQSSITSNATTAPDGTATADLVTEDGGSSAHGYVNNRTLATSTTYTTSFWAKANGRTWVAFRATGTGWLNSDQAAYFNISGAGAVGTLGTGMTATITAAANGWYRCTCTYATAAASGTGTGTRIALASADTVQIYAGNSASGAYFWGVQQEAGAFPSSYIPTTTVSVARTADSCIRTLGSEFSATAGTVVVAGRASGGQDASLGQHVWSIDDGTTAERIRLLRVLATDTARLQVTDGAATQALLDATFVNSTAFKHAASWALNDFASSLNGAAVLTDAVGTLPTTTSLGLGVTVGSADQMNGHIRRFDYYPTRLPNGFLTSA
jgi:hypothetical protein